jgi:hypothetical protein
MATLAPELLDDGLDRPGPEGDRARSAAARRITETKRAEYFSADLVLGHRYEDSPVLQASPPGPGPWSSCAVSGRRLPHLWVSAQVSTLDLVTGTYLIMTVDDGLGARAARAAAAAGLPATVRRLEPPLMRRLGAELLVVRPDQVVSAVWPEPASDPRGETEFLDTTMAMLGGRPGIEATWTRSR